MKLNFYATPVFTSVCCMGISTIGRLVWDNLQSCDIYVCFQHAADQEFWIACGQNSKWNPFVTSLQERCKIIQSILTTASVKVQQQHSSVSRWTSLSTLHGNPRFLSFFIRLTFVLLLQKRQSSQWTSNVLMWEQRFCTYWDENSLPRQETLLFEVLLILAHAQASCCTRSSWRRKSKQVLLFFSSRWPWASEGNSREDKTPWILKLHIFLLPVEYKNHFLSASTWQNEISPL